MKLLLRQASFFLALLFLAVACVRKKETLLPPSVAEVEEAAGDAALEKSDIDRALDCWTRALALRPNEPRLREKIAPLLMQRALRHRTTHRWMEAMGDGRRAVELAPEDIDVHRGTKLFARLEKFLPEIRELDARLALTPEDDQLLADRALLFLRSQDYELGLEDSRAAAEKAPWAMRPRLFRAAALIGLNRAAECAALNVDAQLRFESLTPEFLETLSRLDSEISLEQNNAELRVSRAWQLSEIGQPALALEDAETAFRADEKSAAACAEKSYALQKLGRAEEAFAQIRRATELDPRFATAWHYRGALEMVRQDFTAAIDSLSRALALTETADVLQKREQCYIKTGQFQKAEEDHRAMESLKARGLK